MFVSPSDAATMINDFCIGAVMQEDPYLEQFGSLPDEPPDENPCWDSTVAKAEPKEEAPPPLEQGLLFDFPPSEPKAAAHPPAKPKAAAPSERRAPTAPTHSTQTPYTPTHIPYRQWLDIFCGDTSLALFYFNHQAIKE